MSQLIVVDANPIFAALFSGTALKIIYSDQFKFATSGNIILEVKKYIPFMADTILQRRKLSKSNQRKIEQKLLTELNEFPLFIIPRKVYISKINLATELIGKRDPKDVDILALTLHLNVPIWSNDKDFEGIEEIELLKTEDMLKKI
jgi:predicted nucleic acid-binding protein